MYCVIRNVSSKTEKFYVRAVRDARDVRDTASHKDVCGECIDYNYTSALTYYRNTAITLHLYIGENENNDIFCDASTDSELHLCTYILS